MVIRIDVHPTGENSSNTTRTLPTLVHVRPMYAFCGRFPYVATFHTVINIFEQIHCTQEKGSRHNPQHAGRLIRGSIHSFSPTTANGAVGKSQASVDNRLLGLPGPYHRHAIGTFNTFLRVPIPRSLTDTGGGYNLEGADFPRTTPRPFQPAISPFP
jgi:hypothetical protein